MTDPFDSPAAPDDPPVIGPGPLLLIAAIVLGAAGLVGAAYGLQLLVFIRWSAFIWLLPVGFVLIGLGQVVAAAFVSRGSVVASGAGVALTLLQLLLALGWTVYSVWLTLFSPLGLCWLFTLVLPAVLVPIALPRALRISQARRALYKD